jgi:hypothetical protein
VQFAEIPTARRYKPQDRAVPSLGTSQKSQVKLLSSLCYPASLDYDTKVTAITQRHYVMVTETEGHLVVGSVHIVFRNRRIEISRNSLTETSIATNKVLSSNHETGITTNKVLSSNHETGIELVK